jgi:hypothetical protein
MDPSLQLGISENALLGGSNIRLLPISVYNG